MALSSTFRELARGVGERVLCGAGVTAWSRRRRAADTLILAYHNIVPDGEVAVGDASLHLGQRTFAQQLEQLARTHEVVPLATAVADAGPPGRPRAVITFDDACAGAVGAGVAELARRSMPATIFVSPAFVGGASFWWDALDEGTGAGPRAETRERALTEAEGRDDRVRAWALEAGVRLREVPWHQRCATEAELGAAPVELVTFGSHSWSHPDLTRLAEAELAAELTRPLAWLRERFANVLPWLAFPYGFSSGAVRHAARQAGYEGALRVTGGWLRRDERARQDWFDTPRLNIPAGVTSRGFELRVSGVLD